MNDLHDMIRISCEETITPDAEAQLEHEAQPEQSPAIPEGYELDLVWGPINGALRPVQQPTHKEVAGVCEDAPCCGCCGGSIEDGYGSPADDAWHDANEYPDW